ncbi:SLBB domain-containing protein [Spirosoma sp. BT702]|uniref:SLBB domain-containing protein n=1 Tax=Spirosoma profusum TaxID=2771354 RepID=A0A927AUT2_9BACT|nr:SLBB domain-containing protein [Spirosoma profusum]
MILFFVRFIGGPAFAQAVQQLTDEQVQQFVQQAKSSGLTEAQIESLALSRGFTTADFSRMRQRISQLGLTQKQSAQPSESNVTRTQPITPTPPESATLPAKPAVFGATLFTSPNLSFEPNLRIATPRHYVIGPDDELIIDVFGNAQQTYRPKVSPEGSIRIENLSPVYVNGLTIEQAEQRIVNRLRTLFRGLNTAGSGIYAQLTLGSVRSIHVTLLGQVVRPGTYTLSSLATVFNALYAAGGPDTNRGSFRNIRVYRSNRLIRTIDCYDFLLRADQKDNIRLLDQDVIFIDHYNARIEMIGQVKQPGIYEIRPNETLRNVLNFAGGFAEQAYSASITLYRNTSSEQQIVTISESENATFIPKSGDRYVIGSILDRVENRVIIRGAVFRPGEFSLEKNQTLKTLVKSAEGLREDAFLNRAIIHRLRPNLDPELISVDIGKVLRSEIADVILQREDVVQIITFSELRQQRSVSIRGAVNHPGTFNFADSMTVADLIVMAGGFSEGAISSRMEIARRVRYDTSGLANGQNIQLFAFTIDRNLRLNPADAQLTLRPFDQVFVRTSPHYEPQKSVVVLGEVNYPGSYAIRTPTDRITDLLNRAGGLKSDAYLPAARFQRRQEGISINLGKLMTNPDVSGNLLLENGDTLTIPRRPDIVRIRGEVLNPATVDFEAGKSLRAYINEAGGFTKKAIRRKTYTILANGKIQPSQSFLVFWRFPKPERGMEIVIPAQPPAEQNRLAPTERAALLTVVGSGLVVILTAVRIFTN